MAVLRVLSVLSIVVALAGCGGGGDDSYADDFPPINRDLAALGSDVEGTLRSANTASNAQLARSFAGYAKRLSEIRDRLDQLDPPGSLKAEHAHLTEAATATERALGDIASAARSGDATAAGAAATRLVRSGQDLDTARQKINAQLRSSRADVGACSGRECGSGHRGASHAQRLLHARVARVPGPHAAG